MTKSKVNVQILSRDFVQYLDAKKPHSSWAGETGNLVLDTQRALTWMEWLFN